jgi:hypothetical protein
MTSSCDRAPGHPAATHSSWAARVASISASSGRLGFATNSVLHSASRHGGAFILPAEVGQDRLGYRPPIELAASPADNHTTGALLRLRAEKKTRSSTLCQ